MKPKKRFPDEILETIRKDKILGIKAGREAHRIIGIWAVIVEGRVFVRSWSIKPRSWYRTFLEDHMEASLSLIMRLRSAQFTHAASD